MALAFLTFLLQYPVRTLVADILFMTAPRVVADKATDALDVLDISEETLPAYHTAIDRIRQASVWDSGNSIYSKAQGDLYMQLGTWANVIGQVEGQLPEEVKAGNNDQRNANYLFTKAVNLEPSNPDYHLALYLSKLASLQTGKLDSSITDDLEKAILLYPNSSPLRYEVALQYLILGKKDKALEHAKALASRDDSYRLPDKLSNESLMARRSARYISFLAQSYLLKAIEIAWRASGQDYNLIKAMTPDDQQARDALGVFMELKGVDLKDVVQ